MKGVIFDCDGVILDSEVIYLESLIQYLKSLGIETSISKVQYLVGMKMFEICKAIQEQFELYSLTLDELRDGQNKYFDQYMDSADISVMPGLVDFLKKCKKQGMIISLASSSGKEYIMNLLDRFEISKYFDYVVTGESVEHGKPCPDIFLYTLDKMHLNKEDVMIIEDSVNGIRAGIASGMFTIGFKGSKIVQDTSQANKEVYTFSEIDL